MYTDSLLNTEDYLAGKPLILNPNPKPSPGDIALFRGLGFRVQVYGLSCRLQGLSGFGLWGFGAWALGVGLRRLNLGLWGVSFGI